MRKRMIVTMLLAIGVIGQMGLQANTVLFALMPPTGMVNGVAGSTAGWGLDLQWAFSADWLSVTNSRLISETSPSIPSDYTDFTGQGPEPATSSPLGLGSQTGWTQDLAGGSQIVGYYQLDPAALQGAEDLGPGTISSSFGLTVSFGLASLGLGGLCSALLAWGLRPAVSRWERPCGCGHESRAAPEYRQVVLIQFQRGCFINPKSSVTQPFASLGGRPGGLIRSIFGHFYDL